MGGALSVRALLTNRPSDSRARQQNNIQATLVHLMRASTPRFFIVRRIVPNVTGMYVRARVICVISRRRTPQRT